MKLKDQLKEFADRFNTRSMSEKSLVSVLLIVGAVWIFNSFYLAPLNQENRGLERQAMAAGAQLFTMQQREQQALVSSREDPNQAARQRVERAIAQQAELQGEIAGLAGNLVTPQSMTRLLTSILEGQAGVELVRVENREPQPMRGAAGADGNNRTDGNSSVAIDDDGQVYKHSLLLQLEGDYLSLIRYLQRIEEFPERFFWDQITFTQTEWPAASITLELHTLSTEEGFVGV
jgi:MSHA biogenesis protein MshJ